MLQAGFGYFYVFFFFFCLSFFLTWRVYVADGTRTVKNCPCAARARARAKVIIHPSYVLVLAVLFLRARTSNVVVAVIVAGTCMHVLYTMYIHSRWYIHISAVHCQSAMYTVYMMMPPIAEPLTRCMVYSCGNTLHFRARLSNHNSRTCTLVPNLRLSSVLPVYLPAFFAACGTDDAAQIQRPPANQIPASSAAPGSRSSSDRPG